MPARASDSHDRDGFLPAHGRSAAAVAVVHPNIDVDIYVDDPAAFRELPHHRCHVRPLPTIGLGVKRSKFWMYTDAIARGPFVYLDADIIVLHPLGSLQESPGSRDVWTTYPGAASSRTSCIRGPVIPISSDGVM